MTSTQLDELARLLDGQASARSSAQLSSLREDPTVIVAGYGELQFPLTAARAKKLLAFGEPAPFGKGEDTLLDTTVRHTWHFPDAHVEVDWRGQLDGVLEEARCALGLPASCRLEAQFHSLLVYERGQFFAPHQDSEKDAAMVASLVVLLPCPFSGGELVVHGEEGTRRYAGSRTDSALVAFYADALREVLPVRTGHRVVLTYNLLLHGDTSQRKAGRDAVAEATTLLTAHFDTPEAPQFGGVPRTPTRLAYLLDHSYTPRALAQGVGRLKGVDAERAAILTAAAEGAGCEVTLGLADVHEVRDDFSDDEYLIDSDLTLTHWLTPHGEVVEVGLTLADDVAATTPSRSLRAYASEHEGYMGVTSPHGRASRTSSSSLAGRGYAPGSRSASPPRPPPPSGNESPNWARCSPRSSVAWARSMTRRCERRSSSGAGVRRMRRSPTFSWPHSTQPSRGTRTARSVRGCAT